MEEWGWEAEDSPLPSQQMADVYQKIRATPQWGTLHDAPGWADKEVIPLVDALNNMKGIVTVESCCGHGNDRFNIHFYAESVNAVRPLFELVASRKGWRITFKGNDSEGGRSFWFFMEGTRGDQAYREADELAAEITGGK
jgi:hypothetical protein